MATGTASHYLRSDIHSLDLRSVGAEIGVDRAARAIRGYVVAQTGAFKSGRGRFTLASLQAIVEKINAARGGLKSRFGHPTLSNDGLGRYLGRATNARIENGHRVRADLHLAPSSSSTPEGDLGGYVLRLAAEDPAALSSSLVLTVDKIEEIGADGRPVAGEDSKPLPPIWMPKRLHASDIVDTGDAVDDLLSVTGGDEGRLSPFELPLIAADMLDRMFRGQSRAEITRRANEWLSRYLNGRFGAVDPRADAIRRRIEEMERRAG